MITKYQFNVHTYRTYNIHVLNSLLSIVVFAHTQRFSVLRVRLYRTPAFTVFTPMPVRVLCATNLSLLNFSFINLQSIRQSFARQNYNVGLIRQSFSPSNFMRAISGRHDFLGFYSICGHHTNYHFTCS